MKHSFEKVGDHWSPRSRRPSDSRAKGGRDGGETAGGVDVNGHTKDELMERARKLGVKGRSSMTKQQLGQAIARKQDLTGRYCPEPPQGAARRRRVRRHRHA